MQIQLSQDQFCRIEVNEWSDECGDGDGYEVDT